MEGPHRAAQIKQKQDENKWQGIHANMLLENRKENVAHGLWERGEDSTRQGQRTQRTEGNAPKLDIRS